MSYMEGKCSYWVNVYVNGVSSSFSSREKADSAPYPKSRIAVAEFVIKGKNLEDVIYHPLDAKDCNPGHLTMMVNDRDRSRRYLLQKMPIEASNDAWVAYITACEKDG